MVSITWRFVLIHQYSPKHIKVTHVSQTVESLQGIEEDILIFSPWSWLRSCFYWGGQMLAFVLKELLTHIFWKEKSRGFEQYFKITIEWWFYCSSQIYTEYSNPTLCIFFPSAAGYPTKQVNGCFFGLPQINLPRFLLPPSCQNQVSTGQYRGMAMVMGECGEGVPWWKVVEH